MGAHDDYDTEDPGREPGVNTNTVPLEPSSCQDALQGDMLHLSGMI